MNNVDGAQDRLSSAKNKLVETGQGALQELGTSITVESATAPIKPVTLAGTLFKTAAKGAFKKGLTAIEMREALLFPERDWTKVTGLVDPAALASCPLAINDLTGLAPTQPGAFGTFR